MFFPQTINPKTIEKPHLVTIPYSNYCELGRWALDHANVDYVEVKYSPGYHAKEVGKLRSNRSDRSDSSYVGEESGMHAGRRKYAVPLVCLPEATILRDSWEILDFAIGSPDPTWKTIIDEQLGPAVRIIVYFYLLQPQNKHILRKMLLSTSLYERVLWWRYGDKIMDGMKQVMDIQQERYTQAEETVLSIFEQAGQVLQENNNSFDTSDQFGATELAFCSIASICIMPDEFANKQVLLPKMEDLDSEHRQFIQRCRDTYAGTFILENYTKYRQQN